MKTLAEQQAEAWRLAPPNTKYIAQNGEHASINPRWWVALDAYRNEICKIFGAPINGWDWRNTRQSREEWEAMSKTGNAKEKAAIMKNDHVLYQKTDPDVPESILDQNGDVALALCRICGKGEIDLDGPCLQTEWEDELPPVGSECEFKHWTHGWMKVLILAKHPKEEMYWFEGREPGLLVEENCNHSTASARFFRPIKTQAEKAKCKQINDLTTKLLDCYVTVENALDVRSYIEMAEKLHNSGCYVMHEVNANAVVNIWGMVSNQRGFSEAVLQDFAKAILSHAKGESL